MQKSIRLAARWLTILALFIGLGGGNALAQEVDKGKIPDAQLAASFTTLPWGAPIWDEQEAMAAMDGNEKILWVDTRPESFFKKGSVKDAVLLPYNKSGMPDDILTADSLAKALQQAGLDAGTAKVVFFCQGPHCHRSYNATYVAVTEWGYKPEQIVWFRAGYPLLLKKIKDDARLKRKAKQYLSSDGLKSL